MKLILIALVALVVLAAIFTPLPASAQQAQPTAVTPMVDPNARLFPETGHWMTNYLPDGTRTGFYDYWQREGLARLGYPITGAFIEGGRPVQYTERTRLELHEGGVILLGLLGTEAQHPVTVTVTSVVYQDRPETLQALADAKTEIDRINAVNQDVVGKAQAILLVPGKADSMAGFMELIFNITTNGNGTWNLTTDQQLAAIHQVAKDARGGADYLHYDIKGAVGY